MVKLTRIYTKSGDDGETALGTGERVEKDDPRVEGYGSVDEINAAVGVALLHAPPEPDDPVRTLLRMIQHDLFDLGADLCIPITEDEDPGSMLRITQGQVDHIEREIDRFNEGLGELTSFVLPGGTALAAQLHLARTICRRAERRVSSLKHADPDRTSGIAITYLNRLSDLFFVLARVANRSGEGDVLWEPGSGRPSNEAREDQDGA